MTTTSKPTLVVVDASVLAQFLLADEVTSLGTEKLMTDIGSKQVALLAPPLVMHEMANVLTMAVKRQRIPAEDALLAWQAFSTIDILYSHASRGDPAALRLSLKAGITPYDAAYAALAMKHGCILYTADRRLAIALHGYTDRVKMIEDYPTGRTSSAPQLT